MAAPEDYRQRIYSRYASAFQGSDLQFDPVAAWAWGRAYRHYLRGWLPESPAAPMLDVACGGGKLLYFYKMLGFTNLTGVDISSEQVRLARQVIPEVKEANVLDYLDCEKGRFEWISGLDIVEHFHKQEVLRFLDSCNSTLNIGGRLVLQTPNADSPWGSMYRYGDFTHEIAFNPHVLTRLLELTGFRDIEAREMGPVPIGHSLTSTCRYAVWQGIRSCLRLWNLSEMGHAGSGVFTRVFLISGIKR